MPRKPRLPYQVRGPFTLLGHSITDSKGKRVLYGGFAKRSISMLLTFEDRDCIMEIVHRALNEQFKR